MDLRIYIPPSILHPFHLEFHDHIVLELPLFHFHMNLDTLINPLDSYYMSLIYHTSYLHTLVYNLSSPPYNSYSSLIYLHYHLRTLIRLHLVYNYLTSPLDMYHMSLAFLFFRFNNNFQHLVDNLSKFLLVLFFHFHSSNKANNFG